MYHSSNRWSSMVDSDILFCLTIMYTGSSLVYLKENHIRGVIKKVVNWCDKINTHEAMLKNFVGDIKQQKFYQLWKFKLDTFINNPFIIESNLYGIVTRCSLRWVPWRSTTSLFFNVTFYTWIHFWLGTHKSNTILNNLFFMNIKFVELLSEIDNVWQKRRV